MEFGPRSRSVLDCGGDPDPDPNSPTAESETFDPDEGDGDGDNFHNENENDVNIFGKFFVADTDNNNDRYAKTIDEGHRKTWEVIDLVSEDDDDEIRSNSTTLVHPGTGKCQENEKDEVYEYIRFEFSDDDDSEEILEDPLQLKEEKEDGSTSKDSSKQRTKSQRNKTSKKCHCCSQDLSLSAGHLDLEDLEGMETDTDADIRVHTGKRPFPCRHPSCGKSFKLKRQLTQHLLLHTGERPFEFKCHIPGCSKAFTQAATLKNHGLIHSGIKPFKCDFFGCPAAFIRKGDLKCHTRTHTGEKPWKCHFPGCSRAFTQGGHFRSHEKNHRERPFNCGCGKLFKDTFALEMHQSKCKFSNCQQLDYDRLKFQSN